MRVTVATIEGLLTTGHSVHEILKLYPCLECEDVEAVIEQAPAQRRDGGTQGEPTSQEGGKVAARTNAGGGRPTKTTRPATAGPRGTRTAQSSTGDDLTYTVRSRRYPFLVEGRVDGLPFCLVEEGETWRFVVSRKPGVDPRTVTSSRDGFIVSGWIAQERVRGGGPSITDDEFFDLIDASRAILERRRREGRAADSPKTTAERRTRRRL